MYTTGGVLGGRGGGCGHVAGEWTLRNAERMQSWPARTEPNRTEHEHDVRSSTMTYSRR